MLELGSKVSLKKKKLPEFHPYHQL